MTDEVDTTDVHKQVIFFGSWLDTGTSFNSVR